MRVPDDMGDEEIAAVIEAVLRSGPATTGQLERAVAWASQALVDAGLLVLVMDGRVGIRVPEDDGPLLFSKTK